MSTRSVPSHLRDPNNPPSELSDGARKRWIRNAKKHLQNYNYQCQYSSFNVPSECYNVYHIHRFTKLDIMDIILAHFEACQSFTIDTESVRHPDNLALIQIHSIPVELPSVVLLVQLRHLPNNESLLFEKIQLLFKILLDKNKTIYTWGLLINELKYATPYCLFSFPIHAENIDVQSEFSKWYRLIPPYCEVCKPNHDTYITVGSSLFCHCRQHAYRNPSNSWSLQNAILYTTNCFLDKSETENNWFAMLDPQYTTLASSILNSMINYAVYDCLGVTFIRSPACQRWSLTQLENTPIHILLTDSKQIISDPDLEDVSEEELPLVIERSLSDTNQQQRMDEDLELSMKLPSSSNQSFSKSCINRRKKHSERSANARARRNRKRNIVHRIRRYEYRLIRSLYHRFTMRMVKHILDELKVQFLHVKCHGNKLIIGMKNEKLKDRFEELLPMDIFDRYHYYGQ